MIQTANLITISRIILIIPILMFASDQNSTSNWIALILFVMAGISDRLDGYIARKMGIESSLGALLDLLADKLLIILSLSYFISFTNNNLLIVPALLIIFREIIISSFRQFLTEQEGVNPIKVSIVAKSKTALQITAVSFLIISPNFGPTFYSLTILLFWIAALISLYSLYGYTKNYKKFIK